MNVRGDNYGPTIDVKFPGFGVTTLCPDWLNQQVRPGLNGAIAPAYAITTHVAQGQTMDAGRAVITDTTAPEAAYVALTRGRNDTRLYVLDSPVRTERRAAAEQAEFPILLDEPELLDAIATRLQQKSAVETATSINPKALNVHRLSLLPIDELNGHVVDRDAASGVALHRAQLRALINPPKTYIADYGIRPSADHPHQPIWDRAVGARARNDALGGPWPPAVTSPQLIDLDRVARLANLDRLPLGELVSRIDRRTHGTPSRREVDDAIERRVAKAIAAPSDYLTDVLGTRPTDPGRAKLWDRDASAVERARHRNGIEPSDGHAGLGVIEVLGPEVTSRKELDLSEAEEVPHHDAPQRRGPSLRF